VRAYTSNNETGTGANMQIATYQDPNLCNYGLSAFDQTHEHSVGGNRRLQLRWEIYNVFNRTQFARSTRLPASTRQAIT